MVVVFFLFSLDDELSISTKQTLYSSQNNCKHTVTVILLCDKSYRIFECPAVGSIYLMFAICIISQYMTIVYRRVVYSIYKASVYCYYLRRSFFCSHILFPVSLESLVCFLVRILINDSIGEIFFYSIQRHPRGFRVISSRNFSR